MKKTPKAIEKILAAIAGSKTLCVTGHIRPDGDCIGSQLALALAIREQGKEVVCWNQDPVPDKLRFLDRTGILCTPEKGRSFDCVIAIDAASYERLGTVCEFIQDRKLLINIDHHTSNTRFGDLNWISSRQPSSGELAFRLIKEARWPITPKIANCLFTAISTDTGSFQYPTTLPSTYHTAAELVHHGADLSTVCREVYQSYPLSRVRLQQHLYNHFKLTQSNRIAYCWLRMRDYNRAGAHPNESEGLIDYIRDIEPVVVACIFEEVAPNQIRISLRSKDHSVNVSDIALQFGGGGHKAAAGARIEGSPNEIQRKVLKAIRAALK